MFVSHFLEIFIATGFGLAALKLNSIAFTWIERRNKSINTKFVKRALYLSILVITIICCLSNFVNLDKVLDTILAGSGIVALAVSLASQESLSNLVAGFLIVLCKPFDIGDKVLLRNSNVSGYIEDITFRHTVIRTMNNSRVTVPNSTMNKELIENYQLVEEKSSSFLDVLIEYGSDVELAKRVLSEVISSNPLVIDTRTVDQIKEGIPQVVVMVRELASSGISLRAVVWTENVNTNFMACSCIREQILTQFAEQGISLAFDTITVDLKQ